MIMRTFFALALSYLSITNVSAYTLTGVDIDGTIYDVLFITNDGSTTATYNQVFDPNKDGDFSDNIFHASMSWMGLINPDAAFAAITTAMGTDSLGALADGDLFVLPYAYEEPGYPGMFSYVRDPPVSG